MGNISATQLIILLVIVLLIFGTRRLRNIGSDLGGAIKGFRKGMNENETDEEQSTQAQLRGEDDTESTSSDKASPSKQHEHHS